MMFTCICMSRSKFTNKNLKDCLWKTKNAQKNETRRVLSSFFFFFFFFFFFIHSNIVCEAASTGSVDPKIVLFQHVCASIF